MSLERIRFEGPFVFEMHNLSSRIENRVPLLVKLEEAVLSNLD
jgi:hypothetical protein